LYTLSLYGTCVFHYVPYGLISVQVSSGHMGLLVHRSTGHEYTELKSLVSCNSHETPLLLSVDRMV
jgi:hypothetical protein